MAKFMELNLHNTNQVVTVNADKIVKFWRAVRKDFVPSEIEAIRRAMAPVEREAARERMSQGGAKVGKVSTPSKTRDKIGAFAARRVQGW